MSDDSENWKLNLCGIPGTEPPFKSDLPRSEDYSKALYTFDIGQNDLSFGFQHSSEEQVRKSIPEILSQFSQAVQVVINHQSHVEWHNHIAIWFWS